MQMIRHEHCRKNLPIVEFADGRLECFECNLICQNASTIRDTNRDEINNGLFPAQPNGNPGRMAICLFWQAERRPYNRKCEDRQAVRLPYNSCDAEGVIG